MKKSASGFLSEILSWFNLILPKYNRVLVQGFPNIEPSAIEVANKLVELKDIEVRYVVSNKSPDNPDKLLNPAIKRIKRESLTYFYYYLSTKYIFFTHGSFLKKLSQNQVVVNIWHGLPYKKIRKMVGGEDLLADYTVGTSFPTKKIFSESFGVAEKTVVTTGYPRNDQLIRAKRNKKKVLELVDASLLKYKNLIIWLPTYRKNTVGVSREDGQEIGNPFYIPNFDVDGFNQLLVKSGSFCIIKPHPMAIKYKNKSLSNLLFIDDLWLSNKGITLYDLVGCTDYLISDVSSIILDYLLLNNPIICISTDLEAYRRSRGFYFEDIENWIPAKICKDQGEFFNELQEVVVQDKDNYQQKREELREYFFKGNSNSAEELLKLVFKNGEFGK
jgi:CDP-glycerol glycerophosphotransferase (TagB/SpsB family)